MEHYSLLSSPLIKNDPPSTVCCVARDGIDKLRVIGFTPDLLDEFRGAVLTSWDKGIQGERVFGCAYEFKFRGMPWRHSDQNSARTCRLIIGIMRFMLARGWAIELEMTASNQHRGNMNSWFFRKQKQEKQVEMCGISFKWGDMIRIVDGRDVSDIIQSSVKSHWHRGLQSDNYANRNTEDLHEFKLKGHPWRSTAVEKMHTNAFVMHMMDALKRAGWTVYAPLDSCSVYKQSELNYWIFQKFDPEIEAESDLSLN